MVYVHDKRGASDHTCIFSYARATWKCRFQWSCRPFWQGVPRREKPCWIVWPFPRDTTDNSIVGILGGGIGGQLPGMLGMSAGGVLMTIIGLIKGALSK